MTTLSLKDQQPAIGERITDLQETCRPVLDSVRGQGFKDEEIASMPPRELFGHTCIEHGVCTADNGMTLFDVAEEILSLRTKPVSKSK